MSQPLIYLTRISVPSDTKKLTVHIKPERERTFEMALSSLSPKDVTKERMGYRHAQLLPRSLPIQALQPFQRWRSPLLETCIHVIWTQPQIFIGSPKI